MCDPSDIRVVPQVRAIHNKQPTIFLYDRYPGGIGLSERLYEVHGQLLRQARDTIQRCGCMSGCPACVGPIEEVGLLGKQLAGELLGRLLDSHEKGEEGSA
jgi:DEAD/DEAH box helicase domain-containing protein